MSDSSSVESITCKLLRLVVLQCCPVDLVFPDNVRHVDNVSDVDTDMHNMGCSL